MRSLFGFALRPERKPLFELERAREAYGESGMTLTFKDALVLCAGVMVGAFLTSRANIAAQDIYVWLGSLSVILALARFLIWIDTGY